MRDVIAVIVAIVVLTAAGSSGCKTPYVAKKTSGRGTWAMGAGHTPIETLDVPGKKEAGAVRTANYRFTAEMKQAQLDRVVVAMEEYRRQLMTVRFGKRPNWPRFAGSTHVLILKDAGEFAKRLAGAPDAVRDGQSAAVVPSRREIVLLGREGSKNLLHSLLRAQARLFFLQFAPELPLWLHEGMVSYFEEVEIGGFGGAGNLRIVGRSARKLTKAKELLEAGKLPGLTELTAIEKREDLTDAAELAAWAFVLWSQTSPGNRKMLGRYLDAIEKQGRDKVKIKDYLSKELADFDKDWETWLVREVAKLRKRTRRANGGRKK